jgi:phospholipid-translocating ATPase
MGTEDENPPKGSSVTTNPPDVRTQQQQRNRGYSLRTQMFTRNMQRSDGPPSPIEMEQASSAHSFGPHNIEIQEEPIFSEQEEVSSDKKKSKDSSHTHHNVTNTSEVLPNYSFWASKKLKQRHIKEKYYKVKDFILRKKRLPPSKNGRALPIELVPDRPLLIDERTNHPYCSNLITSSIYTPYNFLPRQLIAQFSKLANM